LLRGRGILKLPGSSPEFAAAREISRAIHRGPSGSRATDMKRGTDTLCNSKLLISGSGERNRIRIQKRNVSYIANVYCCRAADTPSLLTPDDIGAVAADAPAVVHGTVFARRHRSRRVFSPHASGHCESASVAASPGNRRHCRAQPFKTQRACRVSAGNATVIGRARSRRMAPDRENSVSCRTRGTGCGSGTVMRPLNLCC